MLRRIESSTGNVLRRHGIPPAPKAQPNYDLERFHRLPPRCLAGTDFFTVEVLLARSHHLLRPFLIHLESRRVTLAGLTRHPDPEWMLQMARNATDESSGFSAASGTFSMIVIRNSTPRSSMSCDPVVYGHWLFHRGVRIRMLCRALGQFRTARMPVQAHSLWRSFVAPCVD